MARQLDSPPRSRPRGPTFEEARDQFRADLADALVELRSSISEVFDALAGILGDRLVRAKWRLLAWLSEEGPVCQTRNVQADRETNLDTWAGRDELVAIVRDWLPHGLSPGVFLSDQTSAKGAEDLVDHLIRRLEERARQEEDSTDDS